MAKNPSSDQPHEFPPRVSATAGTSSEYIQYDPNLTSAPARFPSPEPTKDTIIPHADFFSGRDEIEKRIGGAKAMAAAFAAAKPDSGGRENIVGVGVGLKYSTDALTSELAVKVYVREKLPMAKVSESAKIPPLINGLPTDVEAIGEILLHSYAKRFPRPVPCGVTCSNINLPGSGTLGCLVVLKNNKLCILSNNHVLADENSASIGDVIIQPGNAESPDPSQDVIGALENFVRIQATGNLVDCAVALTSLTNVSPHFVTYQCNPDPIEATIGMTVMKNGRTTQSTTGVVTDIGVNISVAYDPFPAGAEMRDQIGIRGLSGPFSKPGDSGSLIVSLGTKQPVALLFAGSNDNSMTFGNRISNVISALAIDRILG